MSNTVEIILKPELILCACGCGQTRPARDKWRRKRKFINGHRLKDPVCSRLNHGYRLVRCPKEHLHLAEPDGFVFEHRLVWEQTNHACLLPWSNVHHKNGNRLDNTPENLEGMMKSKHVSIHFKKDMSDRICPICKCTSYKDKKGYEDWRNYKEMLICKRCYSRLKWQEKNKKGKISD